MNGLDRLNPQVECLASMMQGTAQESEEPLST